MRYLFIIPTILIFQAAAQTDTGSLTVAQGNTTTPVLEPSPGPAMPPDPSPPPAAPELERIAIMDYKSVYEASTVEEEVKMAAERFNLTPSQQDIWLTAATDRRAAEKQAREKLDSKTANYEKDGIYRGLRSAHNMFHETIIGYLTPIQKQNLETDRLVLQEKQKRLAKLPPPPPPAPTVTVAPVDSAAIKKEEKPKSGKKSKKKKNTVAG